MDTKREWKNTFQIPSENYFQPRILYKIELPIMSQGRIKTFQISENSKNIPPIHFRKVTSTCVLRKQGSPLRKKKVIELGHPTNTQHRDLVKKKSLKMRNCMPGAETVLFRSELRECTRNKWMNEWIKECIDFQVFWPYY